MKYITLIGKSAGVKVKVSDSDYADARRYEWRGHNLGIRIYPYRREGGVAIKLQNHILGIEGMIDHKDGDSLNNTRRNLRPCTKSQNGANADNPKRSAKRICKYRGVSISNHGRFENKYRARIAVNQVEHLLGHFRTQREAALAYDRAAKKYFRQFARTNFG